LITPYIKHNRPDIIILNKQQKQAYLLDIAVPNSHNITQTYNTKINKYLELSVAMRNLWCLEKIWILPLVISATGIVPQSLFKNLKILDLDNTLVVEIQKGILLYSCHIVRKFLNIDTEHNTQQSQKTYYVLPSFSFLYFSGNRLKKSYSCHGHPFLKRTRIITQLLVTRTESK
jgi:hypothetical protein